MRKKHTRSVCFQYSPKKQQKSAIKNSEQMILIRNVQIKLPLHVHVEWQRPHFNFCQRFQNIWQEVSGRLSVPGPAFPVPSVQLSRHFHSRLWIILYIVYSPKP